MKTEFTVRVRLKKDMVLIEVPWKMKPWIARLNRVYRREGLPEFKRKFNVAEIPDRIAAHIKLMWHFPKMDVVGDVLVNINRILEGMAK